jgi:ligand-binding SRPBCC domain-containing protein
MGVCRVKALISAPLPQVWDFLVRPENMHLWGPLTEPVTGIDRPFQAGDRLTQSRQDFFRRYSQELLVEEVIPHRSLSFRDLSAFGRKLDARAVITVEASEDGAATWIQEEILYSLGSGKVVQWLDRWLMNPVMKVAVGKKTSKAFRQLQAIFASRAESR